MISISRKEQLSNNHLQKYIIIIIKEPNRLLFEDNNDSHSYYIQTYILLYRRKDVKV